MLMYDSRLEGQRKLRKEIYYGVSALVDMTRNGTHCQSEVEDFPIGCPRQNNLRTPQGTLMNYPFAKPMHVTHSMFRVTVNLRTCATSR